MRKSERMKGVHVLFVDGNGTGLDAVRRGFRRQGCSVSTAHTEREAIEAIASGIPDLVIPDNGLLDVDSFELCRRIRGFSTVPIIVISQSCHPADEIMALESGADDYICMPLNPERVCARARSVLRRTRHAATSDLCPVLELGRLRIEPDGRRVLIDGRPVHLTPTERRLLSVLTSQAGRILLYDYLLSTVWGPGYHEWRLVRQAVCRLRAKIERDPSHPAYIHTQTGIGYLFELRGSQGG